MSDPLSPFPPKRESVVSSLLALAATGIALAARFLLDPWLGNHLPYVTFFVAVAVVTWRGHLGASLLAVVLGAVASTWFFVPPRQALGPLGVQHLTGTVSYFAVTLAFVTFGHALHRARRRAEDARRAFLEDQNRLRAQFGPPVAMAASPMEESAFRQLLSRLTLWPLVAGGITVLLLVGLVQYLFHSSQRVADTQAVLARISRVEKLAVDLETGLRGYRITSDLSFLAPFEDATAVLPAELDALQALVHDDAVQRAALAELRGELKAWEASAATVRRNVENRVPPDIPEQQRAKALMDAVRGRVTAMQTYERSNLASRFQSLDWMRRVTLGAILLAGLTLVPWLVFVLRRSLRGVNDSYRIAWDEADREHEQLRVTLGSIGDAVLATDTQGCVTFLNPIAEALTGWKSGEAAGQPLATVFNIINEDTRAPVESPVERVLREGVVVGLANHTQLVAKDGRETAIADSAAPIRDRAGNIAGVVLVFRDQSVERQAEAHLAKQARLLDLSNDTIFVRDAQERITYWNKVAEQTYGYTREEALGRIKLELLKTQFPEPREKIMEALHRDGRWSGELIHTRKDGSTLVVMSRWSLERDAHGNPASILETNNDISARKAAEQALQETSQRFQTLADNIAPLAWMGEPNGHLFWYNQRWLDYTGTTLADMQGWGWEKVHHPDHLARVVEKWRAHLQRGEAWEDTFPLRGKDGRYRWFLSRALPIRDEDGKVLRWFGTNTDVTDLRETEAALRAAKEEAEAASRAKDNFLAQLSHELRTPLTPVLMAATALRDDESLPAGAREQLGMMARNVALEARLIDDLLDLTRIARGKLTLRAEPCDLHSLLGNVVEIVREETRENEISLSLELQARRSQLVGDPSRLQQIFWNLLRNAVRFTPRGGHICIRSHDGPDEPADGGSGTVCIQVIDDGIGFEPGEAEQLFEPFHQGAEHQSGGLGLGLAIARAVVDLHQGRIRAESAGPGRGATFTVEFPAQLPPADGPTAAPAATAEETERPLRLLVVEDHDPTLQVLGRLLTRSGHAVTTASSLAEARQAASRQTFDLVISDLGLPDGTGHELMASLRDAHGLRGIALSGYGMEEDLRRSEQAGFIAHLVKPVDVQELRRLLRRV